MPFAIAANSIPILAFAPIFNNWFGLDNQLSKAMVAAALCFFPVMINTVRGLIQVDPAVLELMRSYAARDRDVLRRVRIPNALPFIFTALSLATTLATIGAIIAEYFGGSRSSLGRIHRRPAELPQFERSWAAILFAAAIGIGLYLLVVLRRTPHDPVARANGCGARRDSPATGRDVPPISGDVRVETRRRTEPA